LVDAGHAERNAAFLLDAPAHRRAAVALVLVPLRLVDPLARDDAAPPRAPAVAETREPMHRFAARVVQPLARRDVAAERRQQAELAHVAFEHRGPRRVGLADERRQVAWPRVDRIVARRDLDTEEFEKSLAACDGAVVRAHG